MTFVIGRIMGQRSQGEGVFVDVLRITEQSFNEISAANVVNQVAEELAAKRIVAHVLNDGAAIGV